jgi:hypothetical protein
MDAKKLLKKHLDLNIPKGVFMSGKQLEQANYDASIGAINEALLIVPEPVLVENTGRESMIAEIKRIVIKAGSFSNKHKAIAEENTVIISQDDNKTTEVFVVCEDDVNCDILEGDELVDEIIYLYEDLSDEVLIDILYLAEIVETDFDKTEKRIS